MVGEKMEGGRKKSHVEQLAEDNDWLIETQPKLEEMTNEGLVMLKQAIHQEEKRREGGQ